MRHTSLLLGFLVLFAVACSSGGRQRSSKSSSNHNSDSSGNDSSSGPTVFERCTRLWTAVCDRWIACGVVVGEAADNCVDVTTEDCCSGATCVARDFEQEAQVDLCEQQMNARTCAVIKAGAAESIPSSCDGLLFR